MRTDSTRWTRRRLGLRLGLSQGKHLHILPPHENSVAADRSTCHVYPAHRAENEELLRNLGRCRQEAADGTNPASAIPFGPFRQTLFSKRTALTIGLISKVDSPLQ
jgi:hypothetical protein